MNFDLSGMPTTLDILHLAFAGFALIELILLVMLLCVIVIGLVRRTSRPVAAPAAEPQPQVEATAAAPTPAKVEKTAVEPPVVLREATPDAALQLLGLLQQEARFIDFIEEDIKSYSDQDIGAAARIVHEGCHRVLHNHFELSPVRKESEDSRVTIKAGFDPASVRLTGNIVGKAPFKGTLVHRGWKVSSVDLPRLAEGHNVNIVAAAEVEL